MASLLGILLGFFILIICHCFLELYCQYLRFCSTCWGSQLHPGVSSFPGLPVWPYSTLLFASLISSIDALHCSLDSSICRHNFQTKISSPDCLLRSKLMTSNPLHSLPCLLLPSFLEFPFLYARNLRITSILSFSPSSAITNHHNVNVSDSTPSVQCIFVTLTVRDFHTLTWCPSDLLLAARAARFV